jgi:hypothetical protein
VKAGRNPTKETAREAIVKECFYCAFEASYLFFEGQVLMKEP